MSLLLKSPLLKSPLLKSPLLKPPLLKPFLLKPWTRGISAGLLLMSLAACAPNSQPDQAIVPSPASSPEASPSPQLTPTQPAPAVPTPTAPNAAAKPTKGQAPKGQAAKGQATKDPIAPPQPVPDSPIASVKPTIWSKERMAGFSSDGSYFLYLESSRDTGAGIPKSRLQVVNVVANTCQQAVCIATRYGESDASLPTHTAEESLLQQTWQVRQDLQLTPPVAGTELAIVTRSRQPNGTEQVTLRLKDGDSLQLQLQQRRGSVSGGPAGGDRAAMQLQVSYGGKARSLDSLTHFRDGILDYSIRAVKLAPDGKRLAILLTATTPTFEGTLATTLVQGMEL